MSAGYISSRESTKAHQTRKARKNAALGSISIEEKQTLRQRITAQRNGSVSKISSNSVDTQNVLTAPIPAERALVVVEQPEATPNNSFLDRPTTQRRLEANRTHQQHLNRPAQMVAPEAQSTRRTLAAAGVAAGTHARAHVVILSNGEVFQGLPSTNPKPIKLFPAPTLINGLIAYEQFRNLPRYLEDAQRKNCIEQAEMLQAKIQRYAALNQATSGKVIWFQVMHYGTVRHWIYDAPANQVIRYWEA